MVWLKYACSVPDYNTVGGKEYTAVNDLLMSNKPINYERSYLVLAL